MRTKLTLEERKAGILNYLKEHTEGIKAKELIEFGSMPTIHRVLKILLKEKSIKTKMINCLIQKRCFATPNKSRYTLVQHYYLNNQNE